MTSIPFHRAVFLPLALIVGGCSGTGFDPGLPAPKLDGTLLSVDLATGLATAIAEDQAGTVASGRLVVRKVEATTVALADGDAVAEANAPVAGTRRVNVATCYLAVTELTQGQWTALTTGTTHHRTPWTRIVPADGAVPVTDGPNQPATGLDLILVTTVCADWSSRRPFRLRLPSGGEWQAAAQGSDSPTYPWGDGLEEADWKDTAHLRTTTGASTTGPSAGPLRVAQKQAKNGFYDLAGNVAELLGDERSGDLAVLVGGSWNDNPRSAAIRNRQTAPIGIPLATAGCRLVLEVTP